MRHSELRRLRRLLPEAATDIDNVIADGGWLELNGHDLGAVLGFTFESYKLFGAAGLRHPATIRPIGTGKHEIAAYLRAHHKPRKAAARAKRRAAEAARREAAVDLDCRASAILAVLTNDRWRTVKELIAALAHCEAFRTPAGRRRFLTGDSLGKAIRRELEKPALAALVETSKTAGVHGQDKLLIRRRRRV
jgi:hypothetical protein